MGGSPSPPPPINAGTSGTPTNPGTGTIGQSQQSNLETAQESQAGSTVGQINPIGSLSYTTSVDPITGQLKYTANQTYSPIEQLLFNLGTTQQAGISGTGIGNVGANFGNFTQDPTQKLLSGTNNLTSQFIDAQNPAWERFMAPQRDQLDNNLRNQGILPGTPAYQQQMDALTQQQLLTKNASLAAFQPQAFGEASQALNMPLSWEQQLLSMSQPGSMPNSFINTPGLNVAPTDVLGSNQAAFNSQFQDYQMEVARQNAMLGGGLGALTSFLRLPTGGGGSLGGDMMTGIMMG